MTTTRVTPTPVSERVRQLINRHDLDGLVDLFAADYESEQPAHPLRAFQGTQTVRQHWSNFFETMPDFAADIVSSTREGETEWVEWRWYGTTIEGEPVEVRGVVIFNVDGDRIRRARLYMEPVETETSAHAI